MSGNRNLSSEPKTPCPPHASIPKSTASSSTTPRTLPRRFNANARWGEIYAEIQDAEIGKPLPNFWVPGAEPPPFTGDSLRAKYVWKDPHDLVFERPVRLKFYLHQVKP